MILVSVLLAPLAYFLSKYNFKMFHTTIEILIALMGFIVFVVAILATKYRKDSMVENIGYGMIVVAIVKLIHLMTYKGMSIIEGYDSNLPTQLWVF